MRGEIAKLWRLLLKFESWCFSSLREAQATKQSIPCRRYWIASLRSQ
jgi:hypothetical protein